MAEGKKASAEDLKEWGSQLRLLFWKVIQEDGKGGKKAPAEDLKDWWSWLRLLFRKIIQEDGRGKKDFSRGSEGLVVLAQTALLEDHAGGWQRGGGGGSLGRGSQGLVVHGLSSNCSSGRSFCRKMVEGKKDLSRGSERRMAEGPKKKRPQQRISRTGGFSSNCSSGR